MMTRNRWRLPVLVLAILIGADAVSVARANDATPYKNLPGVKVPGSEKLTLEPCTSSIERSYWTDPWRNRLARRVYRCEVDNVTVESTRQPNEIDWKKRHEYYKPWTSDGFDR
jgi:hypothetical protein